MSKSSTIKEVNMPAQPMTLKARVNDDGTLQLNLPQLQGVEVEIIIREIRELDQQELFKLPRPAFELDPNHTALQYTPDVK
jgi:hypothetical protein